MIFTSYTYYEFTQRRLHVADGVAATVLSCHKKVLLGEAIKEHTGFMKLQVWFKMQSVEHREIDLADNNISHSSDLFYMKICCWSCYWVTKEEVSITKNNNGVSYIQCSHNQQQEIKEMRPIRSLIS